MAVTTEIPPINIYDGNGVTDTFAYGFKIFVASDIVVEVDGVIQEYITNYTLTGVGSASGGNVVFEAASIPETGDGNVVVYQDIPSTQTTQYPEASKFPSAQVEQDFDRRTLVEQHIKVDLAQCLRIPKNETASDAAIIIPTAIERANTFFGWDANGEIIPAAGTSANLGPVSSFIDSLLSLANLTDLLAALGKSAGTWTPTLTCDTPGDLNVAYSVRVAHYWYFAGFVILWFHITTSTFTHTTASGIVQITGSPYVSQPTSMAGYGGNLDVWQGITKANYTQISPEVGSFVSDIIFRCSGSAQNFATLAVTDMPSGTTKILKGHAIFLAS